MTEIEVDELLLYDHDYAQTDTEAASAGKVYEYFLSRALSSSLANDVVSRPPTAASAANANTA